MIDGRDVVLGVCTVASLLAATVAGYNFYKDYQAKKQNGLELSGRLGAGSFEELSKSPEFQIKKADMLDTGLPEKRQAVATAQVEYDRKKEQTDLAVKALTFIKDCLKSDKDKDGNALTKGNTLAKIGNAGAAAEWEVPEDLQEIFGAISTGRVALIPRGAAIQDGGVAGAYGDADAESIVLRKDVTVKSIKSDDKVFTEWLGLDVANAKGNTLEGKIDDIIKTVKGKATEKEKVLKQKQKDLADQQKKNEANFAALEAALKAQFEQKQ